MEKGTHVISSKDNKRQVVVIFEDEKKIKRSKTVHQTLINNVWVNNISLPKREKGRPQFERIRHEI